MTSPVWFEVATGPESHSLRSWALRQLPGRVIRTLVVLLLAFVFVLTLGRLVDESGPIIGCFSECQQPQGDFDLWDALF